MPSIGERVMLGYDKLLNDTCQYQRYTGENRYNEKEYGEVEEVKCFVSYDLSNELATGEQDVTLTKKIFIDNSFEPNEFDKVDGLEIQSIEPIKGLLVPIIGYKIVV